jgi:hypothetical protein
MSRPVAIPPGQTQAQVVPLERIPCDWTCCPVRATVEVFGTREEFLGCFCRRHGKMAARRDERAAARMHGQEAGLDR